MRLRLIFLAVAASLILLAETTVPSSSFFLFDWLKPKLEQPEVPKDKPQVIKPQKPSVLGRLRAEPGILVLRPKAASAPDKTHSALLISQKSYFGDFSFRGRVRTVRQLREGSAPNPWEVAWVVWNYVDPTHFYYLAIKPIGWEVGKADPAHRGSQRFMATGETPYAIGEWHSFEIVHRDHGTTIRINGEKVATIQDEDGPYIGGRIGVYTEDAEIQLRDVTRPFRDDFSNYRKQTSRRDGVRFGPWIAPFLGYGDVSVVDSDG
jgi:3-keto-disaccharide hydrolase